MQLTRMKTMTTSAATLLLLAACSKDSQSNAEKQAKATNPPSVEQAKPSEEADPHDSFASIEVEEMSMLLNAKKVIAVDANSDSTREQFGTLPGALLLSNARNFELNELPEDKGLELVFYCGSERCTSAPKAAEKARGAGYSSVKVMSAGIKGWVKAGKPVDKT